MKLLCLIDSLGAGGAERSLQELLPWMLRAGIEPTVVSFRRREEGVEDGVLGKLDLRSLEGLSRPRQMRALSRLARQERWDLAQTTLFEASVYGRTALAGSGIPVLTSLVTMPFDSAKLKHDPHLDRARILAVRSLEVATGRLFADHFHAITEAVKVAAVKRLFIPARKITVVHRGRDPVRLGLRSDERRARVRASLGIGPDELMILIAAREDVPKGVGFGVAAFGLAAARLPQATLVLAGRRGNASRQVDRALEGLPLHASARVKRLGHRNDTPDLMAAADLYLLPSLWEGLGCVVLEAMRLELPVIASDLPAVREVTGDVAAAFVPPATPELMAEQIVALAQDGTRARAMAAHGRALFDSRFTLEQSATKMTALFEAVAERRASRSPTLADAES